jgi:hypothetical protein
MKDSHSMESFEVHVPKETAKLVPLNMDSRTGRAEKREPKGLRSQSKEYKEKKTARKQHNEEFFALVKCWIPFYCKDIPEYFNEL